MFRILITLTAVSIAVTAAAAPSATARYFDGLRQRGLFDLAEGEALRRFALPESGPDERAALVAEFARTLNEHARFAEGDEQADLWNRADAAIAEFLKSHQNYGKQIRLDVLRGELSLARGETLRWLAQLVPENPAYRTQAQSALDEAVDRLTASEKALDRRLRDWLRHRTRRTEPLSAMELDELLSRARLGLGLAELERARLATGQNRTDRIAAAESWLDIVARGANAEKVTWRAQIAMAAAALLNGQHNSVRLRLAALETATLPDAAKDAAAAVSAGLLLSEDKPDRAVAFLIDYRRARGALTGELRLLQIEGLAASAAAMDELGQTREAAALRDQIPIVVRWAEAEQGGYWAHRARLSARQAARAARYGAEVTAHLRRAEAARASGSIDEAVDALTDAAQLVADEPELASEIGAARATLLLQAGRFVDAAEAFATLADTNTDPTGAAEAHLLSAYALGRWHDESPSTERREAYVARLEEHRARFSDTPTAAEATLRLARLLESRRQFSQALPLYQEVVADPQRAGTAAAAIARNYENLLRHLNSARNSAATPAEAAARESQIEVWSASAVRDVTALVEPLLTNADEPTPPVPLTAEQAELALRSARILMNHGDDAERVVQLLDRVTEATAAEHADDEADYWNAVRRSALPLRIISLADGNRYGEASRLVASLEEAPVGDLLAVVRGLSELTDPDAVQRAPAVFGASDGPVGPTLSDLRRTATELLAERRPELPADEARQLDLVLARANLADGRSVAAVDRYEAALAERPKDKALLTQAATTLLASGDTAAIARAKDYWRRLEHLEASGSEPWLKARLNVIAAAIELGEIAEARKLLAVTRLLHPQLGGGDTKAAFEAISRRLDSATARVPHSQSR